MTHDGRHPSWLSPSLWHDGPMTNALELLSRNRVATTSAMVEREHCFMMIRLMAICRLNN